MKLHPSFIFFPLLLTLLLPSQSMAQRRTVSTPDPRVPIEQPDPIVPTEQSDPIVPPEKSNPIVPLEPEVDNPDESVGLIVLSDETPLQVLDMLEKLTNKIILRRQDIAAAKINFNSRGSLTKSEAVLALESLLSLNGIMLTDMGGRFMKAVPATNVNSHVPKLLIGSTLDLNPSQQIYAKLFQLDYLQAETTSGTTITPLLSQNSSVVIFQKSNAILITDALINLQRIEKLVSEMDKPQIVREEIKFIKLNFIQATEMQQRIENLIQGPLKSYLEGNTSVTADERTNQLILIAHPGNLEVIMNIVESVDVDAAPLTSSEVFPLRQAKAEEVVPIIEEIISGQKEGREKDAQVSNNDSNNAPQPATPTPPGVPAAAPAAALTAIAPNSSSNLANSSLQFSNFVGLSADERTNSIVAYGTHQDLKTLKDLIDKIDIPLPQVRIEVIITEVTLTENQASGLSEFGLTFDEASSLVSDVTNPIKLSLSQLEGSGNIGKFAYNAILQISENDSDIRILSTPTIVVSHNEEGRINISESRPFETGSVANNNISVTNQIEYRDVGIQLTVTPLIGSDGSVTMQIEQTVDTVSPETSTISRGNGNGDGDGDDDENTSIVNTNPIIGKREANSTITVKNREVIILGGLQQNQRTVNNIIFPILGHVPLIKNVLNSKKVEYDRTELIIFVRPTVLRTPQEANTMSEEIIDVLEESEGVREYLESGTNKYIHMEGSKFEKEAQKRAKKQRKKKETTTKTLEMSAPEVKETVEITEEFSKAAALELEKEMPETIKTPEATKEVEALEEVIEAEVSETQQTATEVTAEVDAKSEETIVEKTEITESKKEMKRRERQEKKKLKKLQKLQRKKETEGEVIEEPAVEEPVIEEPVVEELVIEEPVLTD